MTFYEVVKPRPTGVTKIGAGRYTTSRGGSAWKGAKQTGRKTRKLTLEMKQAIAREMGYEMTGASAPTH